MGLTDKYPYTNYAGINLDYYIQAVNKLGSDIPGYIHDVRLANNVLTFTRGNGENIDFGVNGLQLTEVITPNDYTTSAISGLNLLDVGESDYFDCSIDTETITEALKAGAPVNIKAMLAEDWDFFNVPLTRSLDRITVFSVYCSLPEPAMLTFHFALDQDHTWTANPKKHIKVTRLI
jgi:hypothetical protein